MRRITQSALVACLFFTASTARADVVQIDVNFYTNTRLSLWLSGAPSLGLGWVNMGAGTAAQRLRVTASSMNGNTIQASGLMTLPGKPLGVRWSLTIRGGLAQWTVNTGAHGAVFTGRANVVINPE